MNARLGSGVVDLAVLTGLTVNRTDVDDSAEAAFAHAVEHRVTHAEAGRQIGLNDLVPLFETHLVHGTVTGDSGIVDQYLDRAEVVFDLLYLGLAGIVIADIEAIGCNSGLVAKLLRRFFITGISRGHGITFVFQRQADGFADTASAACYQSYSAHN